MRRLFSIIKSLRFVFHVLIFYRSPLRKTVLEYERDRWLELNHFPKKGLSGFLLLLNVFPEYRSLFYHRTEHIGCPSLLKDKLICISILHRIRLVEDLFYGMHMQR